MGKGNNSKGKKHVHQLGKIKISFTASTIKEAKTNPKIKAISI